MALATVRIQSGTIDQILPYVKSIENLSVRSWETRPLPLSRVGPAYGAAVSEGCTFVITGYYACSSGNYLIRDIIDILRKIKAHENYGLVDVQITGDLVGRAQWYLNCCITETKWKADSEGSAAWVNYSVTIRCADSEPNMDTIRITP